VKSEIALRRQPSERPIAEQKESAMRVVPSRTTSLSRRPANRAASFTRHLFILLLVQLGLAIPAAASVFVVNSTNDTMGSGCPSADCTLKGAIQAAESNGPGLDQIVLQNGAVYQVSVPLTVFAAYPRVTTEIQIKGNGAVIERPANALGFRFFWVDATGKLTLDHLTLRGGEPPSDGGGAVMNVGELTVNNCVMEQNKAGAGGAIQSYSGGAFGPPQVARLTILKSSLRNNVATGTGGALIIIGDTVLPITPDNYNVVTISASSIVNNTSNTSYGGGLYLAGANNALISDTTISGNSAPLQGGGINFATLAKQDYLGNQFSVALRNVTVVNNYSGTAGGGLYYSVCGASSCPIPLNAVVSNTILANNQSPLYKDYKAAAWLQSQGNNMMGQGYGYSAVPGDYTVTTLPLLGALTSNGDPGAEHHRPLAGCLAINHGNGALAGPTDQLGLSRVGVADIGAVEYRPCVAPPAGMTGWWPFDPSRGLKDIAALPDHGWSPNGNAPVPQGMVDGSLKFNGGGNAVEVLNSSDVDVQGDCASGNAENMSIDAWVKVSGAGVEVIVDKREFSGNSIRGYHLFTYQGRLGFQMANGAAYVNYLSPSPSVSGVDLSDGRWHFVAVAVRRCVLGKLYIDGKPVQTFTPLGGTMANNAKLLVGGPSLKGAIDELELFKGLLSDQQVLSLYNAGWAGKCKASCGPYPCD
jgi:hypothetical protein